MTKPLVAILMGSESDLLIMQKASEALNLFQIAHEIFVMSAHRLPDEVGDFAKKAQANGYKVLIGGAGMAAHLCGALAAHSLLPVIGVPLTSKNGLSGLGLDALLSTVQMPQGVPVATVAIDNAFNAGFLAAQILSLTDASLVQKMEDYRQQKKQQLKSNLRPVK